MNQRTRRDLCWLGTPPESRIGLTVVDYEFPACKAPDDWDANWLVIAGSVESDRERWSFQHPCLTTWELAELTDWLGSLPVPRPSEITFTEPLLGFAFDPGDANLIVVTLRGEALPKRLADEKIRWGSGVALRLRAAPDSVAEFAERLSQIAARFSTR